MLVHNTPLFCFGTLMDEDILICVSNLDPQSLTIEPATIVGYSQRNVIDEDFPVLVPNPSEKTPGMLISGLNQKALDRVLFYEGDEYYLAEVTAVVSDDTQKPASVFHSTGIYETGSDVWDFDRWRRNEKTDFLPRVKRYMQLYGKMTATEADQFW